MADGIRVHIVNRGTRYPVQSRMTAPQFHSIGIKCPVDIWRREPRQRAGGQEPEYNSSWRIDFEDGLAWGVLYDKKSLDNWFYFIEIGYARFEINYEEGLAMLKLIAKSRKWIKENL